MDLESLVLGEEGCTFNDIVKVFRYELHSVAVSNNWRDVARELRINPAEIEKWRKDTELLDKLKLADVLHQILESWKEKEGKDATLVNLLKHLENVDLKNVADELREFFSTGNRVHKGRQHFKQTLPKKPRYYILRTLITRRIIDVKVFSSSQKDIFVLDGIERSRLSQLAGGELTDTSMIQVRKRQLSVRFILLKRFGDWALLCDKATTPIHLLRLHEGRFHWICTKGDISALQSATIEENQNELSEETFIRQIETDLRFQTNQPICISDSPGMGKSLLLASIGRQLQQIHPQRCIGFIVISEFVVKIRELLPQLDNTENAVLQALSQILCENVPTWGQLVQKIKTPTEEPSTQIELMFDGFDEVPTENLDLAHECFDTLKTKFNNTIRVWVTTRPQHLHKLEKRFSVLGYNIQAFQEKHQIEFLTSFWNTKQRKLDVDKLEKYSITCLGTLKTKLNKKDEDIAGIPLQCMMIAEVYMKDAHLFCDSNNDRLETSPEAVPDIEINSIADLYQKLIEHKVNKFIRTYKPVPAQINHIWPLHMYLSLELIFPSHAHKFKDALQIQSDLDIDYLVNIGILECRGTTKHSAHFIHRTFAEYLSARFFVCNVIAPGTADSINASKTLASFLFEHVLECSVEENYFSLSATYYRCSLKNSVLCHFLNALLDSQATNYSKINSICPRSTDTMKDVIYACIHSDFGNTIKFLRSLKYLDSFGINYLDSGVLIDASIVASVELLTFLLEHFEHEPFTAVFENYLSPQPYSALHAAVRRGNYSIFDFILKQHDFEKLVKEDERFLDLVYWTVRKTTGGDLDEIQDRVQIVTTLCDLNWRMINYRKKTFTEVPLLAYKVSIVLLKKLIDCGANLFHANWKKDPILHWATEYLSPSDYYDLLQYIPIQTLIPLLQVNDFLGDACLHVIVKRDLATPDILNIILSNGIDINKSGYEGRTCIFYAAEMENEEMRLPTVKMLLERGADYTRLCLNGNSVVHYSAKMGRTDCLRFYIEEKNMNVNRINKSGETPIFEAFSDFNKSAFATVQFLLDHGAKHKIQNSDRENLLHRAAKAGELECLELFLSLGGLDINQADKNGDTPLLCALVGKSGNTVEITSLLLGKGADHTVSNKKGNNVLHLLAHKGNKEGFCRFVMLPSVNVNARNREKDTPLHVFCRNIEKYFDDYDSIEHKIKHLLSLGANVKAKNVQGETPLDIYKSKTDLEKGREDLIQKDLTIGRLLGDSH